MESISTALLDDPSQTATPAKHDGGLRALYAATEEEARRQLTLGIVHEMNNVLGGMSVLSEIYQGGASTGEELNEGLALIHKSTGRAQTLVDHLKILNGPAAEEPTYLNLCGTVRGLLKMFAPLLPKTLAVEISFPPEEMAVYLDEAQLRHVLLNLTLNLRDGLHSPAETVQKLRVSVHRRAGTAVLTLSTGHTGEPLSTDARARLAAARESFRAMGGTLLANTTGELLLELPLVA